MQPIVVLGFGRSGTTWISDIISKATGSLILFEPLHPLVLDGAGKYCYSSATSQTDSQALEDHLHAVIGKQHKRNWLLRNHVPVPLESISEEFIRKVWQECTVSGFKEIRANLMIPWLYTTLEPRIVYIIRHPCAVISSIKNRARFWDEFGWDDHYNMFLDRTIFHPSYHHHPITEHIQAIKSADSYIEKCAVMWAITHAIVIPQLKAFAIPLFCYEDFYNDPFAAARTMFDFLGHEDIGLHPSHIFTPSMTTLKTRHGFHDEELIAQVGAAYFWAGHLTSDEVNTILYITHTFGIDMYDGGGFPLR